MEKLFENILNESLHNNDDSINNLISKIEVYKDIVSNSWIPMPWEIAYSKVPEGLKLTIDTDEWFDEENPLERLIDFILDIYNSDYDSSVRELTGIDIYSDVEFLGGEKSGYATYLIKSSNNKVLNEGKFADKVIPTLIGIGATAGIAAPLTGLAIHQNKSFDRLVDNLGLELSDKANQPDGASCFVNAIKDFKYDGKISKEYGMDIDGLCDYLYDYSNKHFSVTGDGLDISYEDCGDYYLISYEGEYIISIGNPNFRSKKSCHAEDSFKISKDYFGTQFILDEATIPQAKRFATRKHGERGQIRKATGALYIVHPEGVAKIVKDFGGDDEQIQAAWLHDTIEDTGTWEEDLREKFGDRVADLVSELTNDDFAIRSIGKEDYMSNKLVNLSDDALLIKLSDFLYNIKDHCPMKTLERMKKNLEALNFSGRKLDDKCDKLLIDCLEAIDEEM